jgi:hypothetical protein
MHAEHSSDHGSDRNDQIAAPIPSLPGNSVVKLHFSYPGKENFSTAETFQKKNMFVCELDLRTGVW